MIDKLRDKYFQKSKSFLYPALGIRRDSVFTPNGTYITIEGMIKHTDMRLICSFRREPTKAFSDFEYTILVANPLYLNTLEIRDQTLYIFDFSLYKSDWLCFVYGKYSMFSDMFKQAIKVFYGANSNEYQLMETFLYPEQFVGVYAELLDVSVDLLRSVGELCNKWDPAQEMFVIPVEVLEKLPK